MKRLIKFLAYTLGTIVLLIVLAAAYIHFKGVPDYPFDIPADIANLQVSRDNASMAQGSKIASMLCKECHKDFKTGKMTGHIMTDLPKEFGTIASSNITQDKVHGIGEWTDGELYYYLRRSIRKDGHYNPMLNYEGETVPSANITMDKETGIGNWSKEQFREAVKFGKNPKGGPLYYPMFPHTTLSDNEVDAIYAYLQTVPTINNVVARYKPKD